MYVYILFNKNQLFFLRMLHVCYTLTKFYTLKKKFAKCHKLLTENYETHVF